MRSAFETLAAGTEFGNIVFGAGGYSLSGNAIEIDGVLDGSASTGSTTVDLGVTLAGPASVLTGSPGSDITFSQAINISALTLSVGGGGGQADFTSSIAGSGGLTVGDAIVTLSGANTYAGNTNVSVGTLNVASSGALPGGTNLAIATGGTLVLDSSATAAIVSPAISAAPATMPSVAMSPSTLLPTDSAVTAASASVAKGAPVLATSAAMPNISSEGVYSSQRLDFDQTVGPANTAQFVRPWAWLAAIETYWSSLDQRKTTDSIVAARDTVLAQFGL